MGIFRLKPSISSLKVINIPVENMGGLSVGIVRSVGIVKSALVSVCCSNRVRRTDMVYVCIVIILVVCIVYVSIEYSVCIYVYSVCMYRVCMYSVCMYRVCIVYVSIVYSYVYV